MVWNIEIDDVARKQLKKLPRQAQLLLLDYLEHHIAPLDDPRVRGEGLSANLVGLWRYRVRDYRIICNIESDRLVILVVKLGHRKDVYD